MNSKPQGLNFLRPVRRKKKKILPRKPQRKVSQAKRSQARLTLIKYFHLFLESKKKKARVVDSILRREPNSRGGGGKATFETKKGKQNSSEKTPATDATNASQSQSLKGTSRNIQTRESTPIHGGSICLLQSLKKSVNRTILLWLNPLLGLKV